ncbi:hypothetical protein JCGZ_25843 [Jatropha curcas]|uniref:Uncharacterized protein n=1 Tax=Jatropha curcas TaxID=180498 RepID=A0A067JJN7_JATCU|nr:uncharacterized protein LOC105647051 [Jatropha curcas]KDP24186.1 hypothetical protein JCGZ_25843 [Jatropha curcas]
MAMGTAGGSHKGNNNKGKSYGVIILLAFGAALFGVIVIHKLRERRIFNLLVKEKDTELISLHLLLQKEKEYTKEMKRRTEEMKAKIYSLRTQKMETDRKILEMQSTIDSLRDEQKVMESALEEKLNEINMNRDTSIDPDAANHQIRALMEQLKQKESEIEDLKRRFENPYKIWSVNTDDPSNSQIKLNMTTNLADKDKTKVSDSEAKGGKMHESTSYSNGDSRSDDESNTPMKMLSNSLEGLRNKDAIDNGQENKNETSQDTGALGAREENNTANATEGIGSTVGKVTQTGDADNDMKVADSQAYKVARDELQGLRSYQQEEGQEQGTFKGGVKLEMTDNARSSGSKAKGKHAKGKRWRISAQNRRLENNRNSENNGATLRTRKFSHNDQDAPMDREAAIASAKGKTGSKEIISGDNPFQGAKEEDFSNAKLLEPRNSEDSEDLKNKHIRDDTTNHVEKFDGVSKGSQLSQDGQVLINGRFDGKAPETRSKAKKQSSVEVQQYEGQEISGINGSRNDSNTNIQNSAEQVNAASKHERPEEIEPQIINLETAEATGDFYRESVSDLEEGKEEYKEETDESEF